MALDLNISPYYDDFTASKQYEKVLFKPGVAVQARELTQLQSYLTAAIGNHAQFNLTDGARVEGGESTILRKPFIKINDVDAASTTIVDAELTNYTGDTVTGSVTGITAKILSSVVGIDSHAVDKKTLYLAYTGGNITEAGSEQSSIHFISGETLTVTSTDSGRNGDTFVVDNNKSATVTNENYYGYGLFFVISDGIFFLKNQFVTHLRQEIVVDKYNPIASSYVGLKAKESIVTSDTDTSLLDPASGSFNYNSPGADRYKIATEIAILGIDVDGDADFVATDKIVNGEYYQKKPEGASMLSMLGKILAERTSEESGDYVTKKFDINIDEHLATSNNQGKFSAADGGNALKLALSIGGGTAYVNGYRHAYGTSTVLPVNKGTSTLTQEGQTVSTGYGNYFIVDEYCGLWNIEDGNLVTLYSTAKDAVTATTFGSTAAPSAAQIIGQARVKHISYDTGTLGAAACKYRMYLYDIKITKGTLSGVRGIYYSAGTDSGFADVVLESGVAVLKEPNQNKLVFRAPYRSAKTLAAAGGGSYDTSYYHQEEFDVTFAANGTATLGATGAMTFPYSASITQTLVNQNFICVLTSAQTINSVAMVEGRVLPLTAAMFTAVSATSISLDVGSASGTFTAKIFVNVKNTDTTPVPKTLVSNIYVKINTATNAGGRYGPWNLGVPDAFKIQNVYVNGTDFAETGQDQKNKFSLDSGQTDNLYEHSKLIANPGQLDNLNKFIVVKLQCFTPNYTSTNGTWFSVDSYPVNDTGTASTIFTYEIPNYRSKKGGLYALRDCIDFRPYVLATANISGVMADATINPATGTTLLKPDDGVHVPGPITNFSTDVEYYLPRMDKVVISEQGDFVVAEGIPSVSPRPPITDWGMTIAELNIPPYPSISPFLGKVHQKPHMTVGKRIQQTRRYSMTDIAAIEKRIGRLEYYTALSLMEREADSLKILDASGNDRFKNGIFVNVFDSHTLSAVGDPGFKASINPVTNSVGPAYEEDNINLDFNSTSSSNITKTGSLLTLPYTPVVFSNNRFSSKTRNCVGELLFDFYGDLTVYPRSQNHVDTSRAPDLEVVDDSLSLFAGDLAKNLNNAQITASYEVSFAGVENDPTSASFYAEATDTAEFSGSADFNASATGGASATDTGGRITVQSDVTGVVDISGSVGIDGEIGVSGFVTGDVITSTQTITQSATTTMLTATAGPFTENTMQLGKKLIKVDINQFMKPVLLCVIGRRMKPNTKLYAFFDGVAQSTNCTPVNLTSATDIVTNHAEATWASKFQNNSIGAQGSAITTDAEGNFAATFRIPSGTFITGERILRFSDDAKDRKSFVTTSSNASYSSYGLSTVSQQTVISTQVPTVNFGQTAPKTTVIGSQTSVTGVELKNVVLDINATASAKVTAELDADLVLTQHLEVTGGFDPIAQTFTVQSPTGVFTTSCKVFFSSKSTDMGITLQLREVVNGYPARSVLPYGEAYLSPAQVKITTEDSDGVIGFGTGGNLATEFTFEAPVYLKGGTEYCFVLLPQGNSPDYNIWVSKLGENKINTTQRIFAEDTNIDGILFTSANNRTWNAHQAEDITYQLLRANFTSTSGSLQIENSDVDYLQLGDYTAGRPKVGSMIHGWKTAITNAGSGYEAGDIITLASSVDAAGKTLTGVKIQVTAPAVGAAGAIQTYVVTDPGSLDVAWAEGSNPGNTAQASVAIGNLGGGDSNGNGTGAIINLTLARGICSEMNSLKEFGAFQVIDGHFRNQTSPGAIITPIRSGASIMTVTDIIDRKFNELRTLIGNIDFPQTSLQHSFAATNPTGVSTANSTYEAIPVDTRKSVSVEKAVRSYSNEAYYLTGTSKKTINHKILFATTDARISPVVDVTRMSMLVKSNVINNVSTDETGNNGGALSRYINKPVILADGQEAEDILVQVALKQPVGSSVKVYGKFMSAEDDANFIDDIPWIELVLNDDWSPKTSSLSETSFIDFGYKIPTANLNSSEAFEYTTDRVTNLVIGTVGTGYTSAPDLKFSSGAASGYSLLNGGGVGTVTLTNPGRDYGSTPTIEVGTQWITNTTYATGQQIFHLANLYTVTNGGNAGTSAPTHTSSSQAMGTATVAYAGAAAKVTAVVSTVTFTKFKKFSTKLVFLSSNTSKIPQAKELRCIAMQA